jgi:hypothetical protein
MPGPAEVRTKQAGVNAPRPGGALKPLLDKAEISRLQYDAYQSAARVA